MERNETGAVEIIEREDPQGGAIIDTSADQILRMAKKADEYIKALNTITEAALKVTSEGDWVLIQGSPYLTESGATKVARLFGVSIRIIGDCREETDEAGYRTYTYRARFSLGNSSIECEGSRSMREDFFSRGRDGMKSPDEIDGRDVRIAAYTNCVNNGIKRLIPGLRNLSPETLERAGFDLRKVKGYTFRQGSKGGSAGKPLEETGLKCGECGKPISQKVASYSEAKHGRPLCMECQRKASAAPADETADDMPF